MTWAPHGASGTHLITFIFESFVSHGTFGMQSLRLAKALLMDWVRLRSFLLLPTPLAPEPPPPPTPAPTPLFLFSGLGPT